MVTPRFQGNNENVPQILPSREAWAPEALLFPSEVASAGIPR